MSWIDIYLSDGDPSTVMNASARDALSRMPRLRDLPYAYLAYRRAGLPLRTRLCFLLFDVVRNFAYRAGFRAGAGLGRGEGQQ